MAYENVTQTNHGANFQANDYEYNKIFLFNNNQISGTYTNSSGSEVTIAAGTVMGRENTNGKFELLDSTDASSYEGAFGIVTENITVADATTVTLALVNSGDVRESGIVLVGNSGADTLNTEIDGMLIRDLIVTRTQGIRLVSDSENTAFDN